MPRLVLFLVFGTPLAHAQQAIIDRCKQTSSDADRIACLEAALLGREFIQAEPEPASRIDPASLELDSGPTDTTVDVEPEPAPALAPARKPKPVAAPAPEPAGIGAAQVITRQQTPEERRERLEEERGLAVASYSYVPYRRLVVTLENGQVWRQTKGDNQYFRVDLERNQTADISESSLGGYKLRLNEIRRTIRVERVR